MLYQRKIKQSTVKLVFPTEPPAEMHTLAALQLVEVIENGLHYE